jgi:hypothetical protein
MRCARGARAVQEAAHGGGASRTLRPAAVLGPDPSRASSRFSREPTMSGALFLAGPLLFFAICAQLRFFYFWRVRLYINRIPPEKAKSKRSPKDPKKKNAASILAAHRDPRGRREPIAWPGRERAAARVGCEANAPTVPGPVELAIRGTARASRAKRPRSPAR